MRHRSINQAPTESRGASNREGGMTAPPTTEEDVGLGIAREETSSMFTQEGEIDFGVPLPLICQICYNRNSYSRHPFPCLPPSLQTLPLFERQQEVGYVIGRRHVERQRPWPLALAVLAGGRREGRDTTDKELN